MFSGMSAFACHQSGQHYSQDAGDEDAVKGSGAAD
jgi:hypothetical protein